MDDKLVRLSDVQNRCHFIQDEHGEWILAADIINLPAVDAVEVRHGQWVTEEEAIEKGDYSLRDTCSVCGHCDWDCTESKNFNSCPNCGAKMDGEDNSTYGNQKGGKQR